MSWLAQELLFRCCSSKSAGRLRSGKARHVCTQERLSDKQLLQEFSAHSQLEASDPTALVSTTTNFLRAIHLGFKKLAEGEHENDIEIILIAPQAKEDVKVHCAMDLARQLEPPKDNCLDFQYEYLFEWLIPSTVVVQRITMGTLADRGFTLESLCGGTAFGIFPSMMNFSRLWNDHWSEMSPFDRGCASGSAASKFGFHSLNYRLVEKIPASTFYYSDYDQFKDGIEDARAEFVSSIGDRLKEFDLKLGNLGEAAADLDANYITDLGEL